MTHTPEQKARLDIDAALVTGSWTLQNRVSLNLAAGPGVALSKAKMASGHGFADYPCSCTARGGAILKHSLKANRSRALIQMATGSGKTKAAITAVYRLIKYGGASRVLFLVDRSNLAKPTDKEFQGYWAPEVNRKFTELYNVQRLTSNTIMDSSKVVIAMIQRMYSMLKGEPELDPALEEGSQFESGAEAIVEPPPVVYNAALSLEFFDDFLIELTATPS